MNITTDKSETIFVTTALSVFLLSLGFFEIIKYQKYIKLEEKTKSLEFEIKTNKSFCRKR